MTWTLVNDRRDKEREFDTKAEAEETKNDQIALGVDPSDLTIEPPNKDATADGGTEVVEADVTEQLPDEGPSVDEDPLTWMPAEFTDTIDGTVAINRKGYEVMAHHYGIGTESRCVVGPEETSYEYCRVKATATTTDGVTYEAHGSASVTGRGDDKHLLLEMADTRARKRAIAQATGVGMVAVEELQNNL